MFFGQIFDEKTGGTVLKRGQHFVLFFLTFLVITSEAQYSEAAELKRKNKETPQPKSP